MNREIRFRTWFDDEFFYWGIGDVNNDGSSCTFPSGVLVHAPQMQFTGLKDKYGNDIYEGDVLSGYQYSPMDCHQVVFKADRYNCAFVAVNNKDNSHINIWYKGLTVIGNIHENPELMESDK